MPVYKRKLERRRESKCCDIYELHSLISATALQLAPLGLRQSGSCWRSVIHTRRNTKISSNVPISFYIRACGRACALTWLDFLSTTSSAGGGGGTQSCWMYPAALRSFLGLQQSCGPLNVYQGKFQILEKREVSIRIYSKAALLMLGLG